MSGEELGRKIENAYYKKPQMYSNHRDATKFRTGTSVLIHNFLFTFKAFPKLHSAARMRNANRPTNQISNRKNLKNFLFRHAYLKTSAKMIGNTIVASQDHRRDQSKQFLGFFGQRTVFISIGIKVEKTLQNLIILIENLLVHFLSVIIKFLNF